MKKLKGNGNDFNSDKSFFSVGNEYLPINNKSQLPRFNKKSQHDVNLYNNTTEVLTSNLNFYTTQAIIHSPIANALINDSIQTKATLNSGSTIDTITLQFAYENGIQFNQIFPAAVVEDCSGGSVNVIGQVHINLKVRKISETRLFAVIESEKPFVTLGMPFLTNHNLFIDWKRKSFSTSKSIKRARHKKHFLENNLNNDNLIDINNTDINNYNSNNDNIFDDSILNTFNPLNFLNSNDQMTLEVLSQQNFNNPDLMNYDKELENLRMNFNGNNSNQSTYVNPKFELESKKVDKRKFQTSTDSLDMELEIDDSIDDKIGEFDFEEDDTFYDQVDAIYENNEEGRNSSGINQHNHRSNSRNYSSNGNDINKRSTSYGNGITQNDHNRNPHSNGIHQPNNVNARKQVTYDDIHINTSDEEFDISYNSNYEDVDINKGRDTKDKNNINKNKENVNNNKENINNSDNMDDSITNIKVKTTNNMENSINDNNRNSDFNQSNERYKDTFENYDDIQVSQTHDDDQVLHDYEHRNVLKQQQIEAQDDDIIENQIENSNFSNDYNQYETSVENENENEGINNDNIQTDNINHNRNHNEGEFNVDSVTAIDNCDKIGIDNELYANNSYDDEQQQPQEEKVIDNDNVNIDNDKANYDNDNENVVQFNEGLEDYDDDVNHHELENYDDVDNHHELVNYGDNDINHHELENYDDDDDINYHELENYDDHDYQPHKRQQEIISIDDSDQEDVYDYEDEFNYHNSNDHKDDNYHDNQEGIDNAYDNDNDNYNHQQDDIITDNVSESIYRIN